MKKSLTTPTKIKAKRVHGFRRRMKTAAGRQTLKRRRIKQRQRLAI